MTLLDELLCSLDSKLNILEITETKLGEKSLFPMLISKDKTFSTLTHQQTQVELQFYT